MKYHIHKNHTRFHIAHAIAPIFDICALGGASSTALGDEIHFQASGLFVWSGRQALLHQFLFGVSHPIYGVAIAYEIYVGSMLSDS